MPHRDQRRRGHAADTRALLAVTSLVAAALLSAFCSSSGNDDDLHGESLEQVRDSMAAAMFPAAAVMHTHERFEPREEGQSVTPGQDIWRSAGTGEARIDAGSASPRIYADGARHSLDASGAPQSLEYDDLKANRELLGSASLLFSSTADGAKPRRAELDGEPAIRIEVFLPTGDGTGTANVYLTEDSRLSIKVEYPNLTVFIEHELIERDSLAPDFFSPDSLQSGQ